MKNPRYLTAKEAALLLGVSTLTLYAYVSRGLIRSEDLGAKTRIHRYYYEDVERLLRKKEIYRKPDKAAMYALNWGRPVLESSLTLIQNQRLYYRGQDAIQLAQTETFERVAALLWTGNMHDAVSFDPPSEAIRMVERARRVSSDTLTLLGRLIVTLTQMNDLDARAFDLDPAHLAVQGGRMVSAMTYALVAALSNDRIAAQVAARWCADPAHAAPLIDAALILCADHELNASSFAARVAASTGATLYMVVTAGLATLSGGKHGGATLRTAALLNDLARDCNVERHTASLFDVRSLLLERLRRGEHLHGFGHRLYPDGDPRAAQLLKLLAATFPDSPTLAFGRTVIDVARELTDHEPNIDFALALLGFMLGLPKDAPFALFALGRSAGWIAHAIEQYSADTLIRPRARYVGVLPDTPPSDADDL